MASSTSNPLSSISSSSTVTDNKVSRQSAAASSQCVTLTTLPPLPVQSQSRAGRTTAYCRKIARNVVAMATGDAPAAVAPVGVDAATEISEIVKTVQAAWDKVEDKYAVTSLAVAAVVALWGSAGVLSAIDRLPLVPGLLEVVGIGYTGRFAYKYLVFKPDREALIQKIKCIYKDIVGTS